MAAEERWVEVASPDFKFSCAHFVAFKGFRERLHGHNYTVQVRISGVLCSDGYVIDFGDVKKVTKAVCRELNEYVLIPMKSDVLQIKEVESQIEIRTEDGAFFSLPRSDCKTLDIVHSTAEELAEHVWGEILRLLGTDKNIVRYYYKYIGACGI
eukprot:GEMP01084731.1.p1 GENE.GEMP01084731.1~~GEMP01084731.1.p1  ORF type:complete len:154 (+),score=29.18 GEMP01084731.1:97-558(+)